MKASEYIKQHGDFEITEDIEKCIPHKPKSVWDLKEGDRFYFVDSFNNTLGEEWQDNNEYFELKRKIGFIALAREELDFKLESMKVYEELKRFAKDFTDDEWIYGREKYRIFYDFLGERIYFPYTRDKKTNSLYFESAEKAEEAVKAVGEERVKKYYLGVGK